MLSTPQNVTLGHTFPYLAVSGSAYEMGRQHGAQAGDLIRKYLQWIEFKSQLSRETLCGNAMAVLPFIEALSPAYVEEVRGLADGARLRFEEAVLCQARFEAAHRVAGEGCTAFALAGPATADGQPLAGQNQDLEPEYADFALVLHVKPSDGRPRAVMLTFAGQLGYHGMNEHGLSHFANQLYDYEWRPGLPHYPLKRTALEKRTVAECVALYARHRTCSAGNVMLCDGAGALADVEVRPEGIRLFHDDDEHRRIHTNHYLAPEFAGYETHTLPDSCPRLDRMRALVNAGWGTITVEALKTILADHADPAGGICRHGATGSYTIAGYIAEPAHRRLHIRRGLGCSGTWQTYEV